MKAAALPSPGPALVEVGCRSCDVHVRLIVAAGLHLQTQWTWNALLASVLGRVADLHVLRDMMAVRTCMAHALTCSCCALLWITLHAIE